MRRYIINNENSIWDRLIKLNYPKKQKKQNSILKIKAWNWYIKLSPSVEYSRILQGLYRHSFDSHFLMPDLKANNSSSVPQLSWT